MSDPDLIVMAAGIGSRYGGLKQIEPIGPDGEIILDYSIYDAKRAGFGKVVFVINKEIKAEFQARIDQTIGQQCEIAYVLQDLEYLPLGVGIPEGRQKPWGTAHAVMSCQHLVDTPFAVINADDFYGRTSFQMLSDYLRSAQDQDEVYDFCMVGYNLNNTLTDYGYVARGVCTMDRDGYLKEVHERTRIEKFNGEVKYTENGKTWIDIAGDSLVSMNMWGFTPVIFKELDRKFVQFLHEKQENLINAEYFLPDVVNQLLEEKKAMVKVLPTQERWFGITYKDDKFRVKKAVRELIVGGIYPESLWR
jgi:NDP-sugar pyrophosphorylase family protein